WGFVVDRADPVRYGGTGEPWPWRRLPRPRPGQRLLVAGGVGPGNARAALAASGADGIDVASGVESSPGIKDPELLARLFEEVEHGAMEERA
ncbi:MAG TPA: N-(5'-phosphoribosyl)anthranilate isomerase, partial [Thermoanaerobaculia bacterium]|nr:N-(5'-phosphoribosyl)anthranilate isomerase [Thermoanaerobaculia bacterium]